VRPCGIQKKIPVIITKHWKALSDNQLSRLAQLQAVINTSVSGMDTDAELSHRIEQIDRIKSYRIRSVCRVVTCQYGSSTWARQCKAKQDYLLSFDPVIDNPLRASKSNQHVVDGDIILTHRADAVGGGQWVSLHNPDVYLGVCPQCPDQCGVETLLQPKEGGNMKAAAVIINLNLSK
jgi:ribosomal protein S13